MYTYIFVCHKIRREERQQDGKPWRVRKVKEVCVEVSGSVEESACV